MKSLFAVFLIFSSIANASSFEVGASVTSVVSGSDTIEPAGDFYRAVLMNPEQDACLTLQKVNIRVGKAPKVLENRKLCSLKIDLNKYSLDPAAHQEATFSHLSWKGFVLSFNLLYTPASQSSSPFKLKCSVDPRQNIKEFVCSRE